MSEFTPKKGTSKDRHFRAKVLHKRGIALVVTLFVVTLLVVIVVAFLLEAGLHRQIAFSDAGMARAELLAKDSVDVIRGDLLDEIQAGSTATQYTGSYTGTLSLYRCFVPTSAAVSVPYANVPAGSASGALIKESAQGTPFWTQGTSYSVSGPDRASTINTTTASLNGRSISTSRWNKPLLAGTIWPSGVTAPDWIYVNRQGAIENAPPTPNQILPAPNTLGAASSWSDSTPSNGKRIIGRYAYTVYDVGGLLDINVAGTGTLDLTAAQQSYKESMASADLSMILGTLGANNFYAWRKGSVTSPTYSQYLSMLTSNTGSPWFYTWGYGITGGFMRVYPGYQAFANRQDLINYSNNNPLIIPPSQLPNLTMFTRAVDAPSFMPASYSYTNLEDGAPSTYPTTTTGSNPNIPLIRYSTGTLTGTPLFSQRFPLSQIALLSGNRSTNAAAILKTFGLVNYDGYSWYYVNSVAGTDEYGAPCRAFRTPSQIAALGRPADFFETLAAGIENDSIGSCSNRYGIGGVTPGSWNSYIFSVNYDLDKYLHVMQIGANIINQYMANDWPVCIQFPSTTKNQWNNGFSTYEIVSQVNGVTNMPYLNTVYYKPYRKSVALGNIGQDVLDGYYLFELWNPHLNASSLYSSGSGPSQFHILAVNGEALEVKVIYGGPSYPPAPPHYSPQSSDTGYPPNNNFVGGKIVFNNNAVFAEPTVLTPAIISSTTDTKGEVTEPGIGSFAGFWVNSIFAPDGRLDPTSPYGNDYHSLGVVYGGGPSGSDPNVDGLQFCTGEPVFHYEYLDSIGTWHLLFSSHEQCGAVPSWADDIGWDTISNAGISFTNFWYADAGFTGGKFDPRTRRFGMIAKEGNYIGTTPTRFSKTLYPASTAFWVGRMPWGQGYTQGFNSNRTSGNSDDRSLSDNVTNSTSLSYQNQDGIQRRADGDYANGITPTAPLSTTGRPIMLNRPFVNVGELGYADRDEPWKTLDFSSTNTADAGLIDLFCVDQIDNTSPGRKWTKEGLPIVAGRLNPNSKNAAALSAMLSGSRVNEMTGSTLTQAQATTIANAWVAWNSASTANASENRGDYVKFLGSTQLATALATTSAPTGLQFVKAQKESISRALANVSNTRTWNLMIDVVAQSGSIATGASDLSKFQVDGERRYWVHLALDRVSGEVVDQIWEPVSE